jgi:drug/metabolite transporter (DMT)-like permease
MNATAVLYALASAVLFGVSTPAAKALLGTTRPAMLAGLLYCGAGLGALLLRRLMRTVSAQESAAEAPLAAKDLPWLAGAIAAGGIARPLLLMIGLARTEAATASLMLTLEGVATALMAWFVFHENFDRRIALGMACLVAGAALLSWTGRPTLAGLSGPLAIVGACVAWGLDNNLTRKVSLADPLQIVELKGLVAGPVNVAIALATGDALSGGGAIAAAALVGVLGYGLSLALFVLALRHLGTARTGAYFSTAPFFGAAVAVWMLAEPLSMQLLAAAGLMAVGVWLHVSEQHEHVHVHSSMTHEHAHSHDKHHQHGTARTILRANPIRTGTSTHRCSTATATCRTRIISIVTDAPPERRRDGAFYYFAPPFLTGAGSDRDTGSLPGKLSFSALSSLASVSCRAGSLFFFACLALSFSPATCCSMSLRSALSRSLASGMCAARLASCSLSLRSSK